MAARNLRRNYSHFTPAPVTIFAKAIGAAGASPTSLVAPGVKSFVWNSTGNYTLTLEDKYNKFLSLIGNVVDPTAPAQWVINVLAETVASTKTIQIVVYKAGVAADLTSDETVVLRITVSNSSRDR